LNLLSEGTGDAFHRQIIMSRSRLHLW
jgi:hypothetical protein